MEITITQPRAPKEIEAKLVLSEYVEREINAFHSQGFIIKSVIPEHTSRTEGRFLIVAEKY